MSEFDYGNARVRAMKARLLDRRVCEGLLDMDLGELLSTLANGDYKHDVEQSMFRFSGLQRLHEALRSNLAGTLRKLPNLYGEEVRGQFELLSSRWDAANLVTVVRGHARHAGADEIIPLLIATRRLDDAALLELARQPGLRAALELLVAWRVPSGGAANEIFAAWPQYEHTGDLAVVEHAIAHAFAGEVGAAAAANALDPTLETLLRRSIDKINVMSALRARAAGEPELPPANSLPGGTLSAAALDEARTCRSGNEVVARILEGHTQHWTHETLQQWARDGDVTVLERQLDRALVTWAMRRLVLGDPLSIAVPLGFLYAKDNEVRNLRLIGAAAAGAIPTATAREQLLFTQ